MDPRVQLVKLYLTQFLFSILPSPRKTIILALQEMKLVKLLIKRCIISGTPKNSKSATQISKLISSTIFIILTSNANSLHSSFRYLILLHLHSMNVIRNRNEVSLLLLHTSTQANLFTALQHFLLFDWSSSSIVFTGIIFFAHPLTFSTDLQHFATLHCFNWSSLSQLLQLVLTESTASTGLHCFNWSFRHWPFATRIECFKLN